ncbi:hypothetical protein [Flammeovirga kamogawensis]|uniref:Tetratricopeptide repeat protein n=1 Tax=Flammeovirga kamogawensis TaxID=373891 RepID=A0ABX8GRB2_9BACT|nr:hypothetical protein [Flammeovirga kamogawensis]MBB6462705.1 tetratricopeptide (TPR) repeat protein [Flammeovirga kamogawensis]QWG06061.1 hypothetical protein KM029_11880 [Flammeovirga kamogawensis]TRX67894.1 hypothetical protein EO216_06905 [Flammeovirga kamogawensis]
MKNTFLLLLILFFSLPIYSQDFQFNIDELTFNSEREKTVFIDYKKDSTNFLNLLVEIGNTGNSISEQATDKLNQLFATLEKLKVRDKKPKKQVQIIYKEVHNQLFAKYIENISFYKIFENGEYNCATATSIYALVLDHFSIPYAIKKTPNHVYLQAYPNAENITMESTSPNNGFRFYSDKTKENLVNTLLENKLVSKSEVNTKGVNAVFDEYFFKDENITYRNLISILYSNEGFKEMGNEDFKMALSALQKGYSIYPNKLYEEVIVNLNLQILSEQEEYSLEYAKQIVYLSRYIGYNNGLKSENFSSEFNSFQNEYMIKKQDTTTYKQIYAVFQQIEDSIILDKINFDHYSVLAYHYYENKLFEESLATCEKALTLQPQNSEMYKVALSSCVEIILSQYTNNLTERIAFIEQQRVQYPFLEDELKLELLTLDAQLNLSFEYILKKDLTSAKKYIADFEKVFDPKIHYGIPKQNVVALYDHLGMLYFKRRQTTNAKKAFLKGLSYYPNTYSLEQKIGFL